MVHGAWVWCTMCFVRGLNEWGRRCCRGGRRWCILCVACRRDPPAFPQEREGSSSPLPNLQDEMAGEAELDGYGRGTGQMSDDEDGIYEEAEE
jgi:hypothetical protein